MLSPLDGVVNYSYDATKQILQIRFHSGNVFEYLGVTSNAYDVFNAAADKNIVFNRSIRTRYLSRQVFEYVKSVTAGGKTETPTEVKFKDSTDIYWTLDDGEVQAFIVGKCVDGIGCWIIGTDFEVQ